MPPRGCPWAWGGAAAPFRAGRPGADGGDGAGPDEGGEAGEALAMRDGGDQVPQVPQVPPPRRGRGRGRRGRRAVSPVALVLLLGGASAVSVGPPAVRFRSAARGRSPQGEGLRGHPSPGGEGGLQAAHLSRIRGASSSVLVWPQG